MRDELRATTREHWSEACYWLIFTVGIGCVPFWGISLLLGLLAQELHLSAFIVHGELAVFSSGLIAPAIPLILRDVKGSPYKQPKWFMAVIVFHLIVSTMVFTAAVVATVVPSTLHIDAGVLVPLSVVLLFVGVTVGFFTTLLDNLRADPNVIGIKRGQQEDLRARFVQKLEHPDAK